MKARYSHCSKGKKNPKDVYSVREIRAMEGKPRYEDARRILEEVARQVQPIMIKHKWSVGLLSEFRYRNFLGMNTKEGAVVELRLRNSYKEDEFLPFDYILDTMLHELCHNAYGEHHSQFFQLLNLLRKEYEELVSTGIIKASSEEFDLRGRNLADSDILCQKEGELGWLSLEDQLRFAVDKLVSAFSDLEYLMLTMRLESDTRVGNPDHDLKRANHLHNRFHECRSQKRAFRYSTTASNFRPFRLSNSSRKRRY